MAAYRWPEYHRAMAPEPARYAFTHAWPITVNGLRIGTVRRVLVGLNERYVAHDLAGGSIRPDLHAEDQPTFDSPHEAAQALAAYTSRMGWDDQT